MGEVIGLWRRHYRRRAQWQLQCRGVPNADVRLPDSVPLCLVEWSQ